MGEIPPNVAMVIPLSGTPRDMVLAGIKIGIEHAAKIVETCATEKTDATLADATPKHCFELAAMLVRNQGAEAITSLEARQS